MLYVIPAVAAGAVTVLVVTLTSRGKKKKLEKAKNLKQKGKYEEAILILRTLLESDPTYEEARWLLAQIYEETGDYLSASEEYQYMLDTQLIPADIPLSTIHKKLATSLFYAKKIKEAYVEFKKISLADLNDSDAPTYIGRIFASQELFDEAIVNFQKAISRRPHNAEAYFYMGLTYAAKSNFKEAAASLEKAAALAPGNIVYKYYAGSLNWLNKDFNKALTYLRDVAMKAAEPEYRFQAADLTGLCFLEKGIAPEAVNFYRLFLPKVESFPKLANVRKDMLYNLGVALARQGDIDGAIKNFNIVKNIDFGYRQVNRMPSSRADFDLETVNRIFSQTLDQIAVDTAGAPHLFIFPKINIMDIVKKFEAEIAAKQKAEAAADKAAVKTKTLQDFLAAKTDQFRETCRKLVKAMGYEIEKEIRDPNNIDYIDGKGMDFIARKGGRKPLKAAIMIRRWESSTVGEVPIQELIALMHNYKTDKGIFLSTSSFSEKARQMAANSGKIDLYPPEKLETLLRLI